MTMRPITRLSDLATEADAFLIDQFGAIHDGETPYPGAIDTLRAIRATGRKIILLSNSGRRAGHNRDRLTAMGVTPDCYDASLSSGEIAWADLRKNPPPCLQRPCRVLLFARSPALDILEGFDVEIVDHADHADLVMIAGSQTERYGFDALWARMQPAAVRAIPAICTNADRVMMVSGTLHPGSGALAEAYAQAGGPVRWYGKPHPTIYHAAFTLLPGIPHNRIFGVGDSIEHDIAGAAAQGCGSILLRTGILAGADEPALEAEMIRFGHRPGAVCEKLQW